MEPKPSAPQPAVRFVVLLASLFIGWYFLYEFYLHPKTNLDKYVAHSLVSLAEFQLRTLGFDVAEFGDPVFRNQVGIEGSVGIVIGAPCDGIVLFALFTFFIVAFPGAWKHKLWFIPAGIAALHIINSLRVATLAWLFWYKPEWLDFNHDYTFTILVYAFVFCLWYVWVRKFSLPRKKIRE